VDNFVRLARSNWDKEPVHFHLKTWTNTVATANLCPLMLGTILALTAVIRALSTAMRAAEKRTAKQKMRQAAHVRGVETMVAIEAEVGESAAADSTAP